MTKPPPNRRELLFLLGTACVVVLAVVVLMSVFSGDRSEQVAGSEIATGKALVEANCASCHATGRTGDSPEPAAPPFRTFGEQWPVEHLEEALAEGIVVGHETIQMPEIAFEADEVGAIIAYLMSLEG